MQLIIQPVNYLIPAGYMGNIYIFHNVPDGTPLKQEGFTRIYEIPGDGILRSQAPSLTGATSNKYFYVTTDGKREKILGYWESSLHNTPENRADPTVGIFYPRAGSLSASSTPKGGGPTVSQFNCEIKLREFAIGTKAYLLSTPNREKDLFAYVREKPICR